MTLAHLTEHLEAAHYYNDELEAVKIIHRYLTQNNAPDTSISAARKIQIAYWENPENALETITLTQG